MLSGPPCRLSDLLYLPMPTLPTQTHKVDSIIVTSSENRDVQEEFNIAGSKWEDEEERRFFEDIQDLQDFVPKGLLGIDEKDGSERDDNDGEKERKERAEEEVKALENELKKLELLSDGQESVENGSARNGVDVEIEKEDEYVFFWSHNLPVNVNQTTLQQCHSSSVTTEDAYTAGLTWTCSSSARAFPVAHSAPCTSP